MGPPLLTTLRTSERFETFGPDHLALLGLAVVGCVVVALGGTRRGRRLRSRGVEPTSSPGRRGRVDVPGGRALAVLLLAVALPLQVYLWLPGEYDLATSWPVHLCDVAWVVAAYALWTGRRRACQLLYYWGLVLVPQAMLTPDLVQVFPHPRYVMFWALHLLVVWVAVHLTWGTDARPSWAGYRWAVVATLVWAGAAMSLNALLGTNYGYLNAKPPGGSVLDLLPPWPTYVAVQVVVVAVVWALMTWPWVRSSRIGADQGVGGTLGRL